MPSAYARSGRPVVTALGVFLLSSALAVGTAILVESDLRRERAEIERRVAELDRRSGPLAEEIEWARAYGAKLDALERRVEVASELVGAAPDPVGAFRRVAPILDARVALGSLRVEGRTCFAHVSAPELSAIVRAAEAVARLDGAIDVEVDCPRRTRSGFAARIVFEIESESAREAGP